MLYNQNFSDLFSKFDEKIFKAKLTKMIEMLKTKSAEDLKKEFDKIDKDDLLKKIDDFEKNSQGNCNIDITQIKQQLSNVDTEKLSQVLGNQGDEILKKINEILNNNQN